MSEDFPRAGVNDLGELAFVPQLMEPYLSGLVSSETKELIRKRNFKVISLYDGGNISFILPGLLETLGCEVHSESHFTNGPGQPRTLQELLGAIEKAANLIQRQGADLGIIVDQNNERLLLKPEIC